MIHSTSCGLFCTRICACHDLSPSCHRFSYACRFYGPCRHFSNSRGTKKAGPHNRPLPLVTASLVTLVTAALVTLVTAPWVILITAPLVALVTAAWVTFVSAFLVILVTAAWVTFVSAFCVTIETAIWVTLVLSEGAITRTIIITVLVWRFLGLFRRFLRGSGGSLFGAILFRQRLIKSLKVLDDRCWGVRRGKTFGKSFVANQPCNQEWNQPTLGHLPYLGLWRLNSV